MELALLLAILAGLYYTIKIGREKTIAFNALAIEKYNFKPIKLPRIFACSAAFFILWIGFAANDFLNLLVAIIAACFTLYKLFKYIEKRSDTGIAKKSLGILLFYGILGLVGILVMIALHMLAAQGTDEDDDYLW